jgi:NADH-quinone oxidoreductase subunit L
MQGPAVYLAFAGAVTAWFLYLKRPDIPDSIATKLSGLYNLLDRKYYFDDLYIKGFAAGGRRFGQFLWNKGDELIIDGILVNGTANQVKRFAGILRRVQTGYLYHYAFAMFFGMTLILAWLLWA